MMLCEKQTQMYVCVYFSVFIQKYEPKCFIFFFKFYFIYLTQAKREGESKYKEPDVVGLDPIRTGA